MHNRTGRNEDSDNTHYIFQVFRIQVQIENNHELRCDIYVQRFSANSYFRFTCTVIRQNIAKSKFDKKIKSTRI